MNCRIFRNRITELASLRGDNIAMMEIEQHAKACDDCRAEMDAVRGTLDAIRPSHRITASARFKEKTMQQIHRLEQADSPSLTISPMFSAARRGRTWAYAASVAALVVAALSFTFLSTPTVGFAQVIEKLVNARSLVMKGTLNREGFPPSEFTIYVVGAEKFRSDRGTDHTMIIDYASNKSITLSHNDKTYMQVDISDVPREPAGSGPGDFIQELRGLKASAGAPTETSEVDGRQVQGFRASSDDTDFLIWADAKTGEIVWAEYETRAASKGVKAHLTYFEYSDAVDDSLFDTNPPAGYKPKLGAEGGPVKMQVPTEEDFLTSLRIFAKLSPSGQFPDSVDLGGIVGKMPPPQAAGKTREQLIAEIRERTYGLTFVAVMKKSNDFHYVGKGIALGAADQPIAWYRPNGSPTYRVIYADLTVKDVAPENLPKAP